MTRADCGSTTITLGNTDLGPLTLRGGGRLLDPAATWPDDSLLGFIDSALAAATQTGPFGPTFEAPVCNDIGQGAADFIGVIEAAAPRVVFIPAKWTAGATGGWRLEAVRRDWAGAEKSCVS